MKEPTKKLCATNPSDFEQLADPTQNIYDNELLQYPLADSLGSDLVTMDVENRPPTRRNLDPDFQASSSQPTGSSVGNHS